MGLEEIICALHPISLSHLPVYVINLANKRERFMKAQKQLHKAGLMNVILLDAIDGDTAHSYRHFFFSIHVLNNIVRGPFSTSTIPTWRGAGCALSHLCAWEQAQQHTLSLIVEDDILIQNFDKFLVILVEAIHTHTSSFSNESNLFFFNSKKRDHTLYDPPFSSIFSNTWMPESSFPSFSKLGDSFIDTTDLIGSHCYLLSGTAAKVMITHVYPIEYQIDLHMSKTLRKKCALNVYYSRYDAGVLQDPSYKISSVQYYTVPGPLSLYTILDQQFPIDVCSHIYSFCKPWYEFNRV